MSLKRSLGVDPANIISSVRGKKRREDESVEDIPSLQPTDEAANNMQQVPETVRDSGLQIWTALRQAVGTDGIQLSHEFMRLPSKRQYPDYYEFIKHPISLDEIKLKLEHLKYANLDLVKHDFDTCFRNAKRYNQRDSLIWKNAKALQKIASKEYSIVTGSVSGSTGHQVDVYEHGKDIADDDDEGGTGAGKAHKKTPSLTRVLKNRIGKLVAMTDDSGRLLSSDFMELPDRKYYADYYQVIKKTMCFDTVLKKIRRKEYQDVTSCALDVELIFRNAFEYNVDHSSIWEDAVILKEHFRQLMASLPQEYAAPAYGAGMPPSSGKIKLRLSQLARTSTKTTLKHHGDTLSGLTVKLPPTMSLAHPQTSDDSKASAERHVSSLSKLLETAGEKLEPESTSTPQVSALPMVSIAGPRNLLSAQITSTTGLNSIAPLPPQPEVAQPLLPRIRSESPVPVVHITHPIRTVTVRTLPKGRVLLLDREDRVNIWSLRLGHAERAVKVSKVIFDSLDDSREEKSASEDEGRSTRLLRTKLDQKSDPSGGAHRFKDKSNIKEDIGKARRMSLDTVVRLNGSPVKNVVSDATEEWMADLSIGMNLLEVTADKGADICDLSIQIVAIMN